MGVMMNIKQAVQTVLIKKFATFTGRAPRSEYWWWVLFVFVTTIILSIVDAAVFMSAGMPMAPLSTIFSLATLVPYVAVTIRRMHDVNRSGWWMLIPLTVIGIIPYLYWMCSRGTAGDNRFGPDPLAGAAA